MSQQASCSRSIGSCDSPDVRDRLYWAIFQSRSRIRSCSGFALAVIATVCEAPKIVLLIIEVADSTASFVRGTKLPLYAKHDVPEVWTVDLIAKCTRFIATLRGTAIKQSSWPPRSSPLRPRRFPTSELAGWTLSVEHIDLAPSGLSSATGFRRIACERSHSALRESHRR